MTTIHPARIDFKRVEDIVAGFPFGPWRKLAASELHAPTPANPTRRIWRTLNDLSQRSGNYAFLFPSQLFATETTIELHGPNRKRILFRFDARDHVQFDGQFVAYVGKASDLRKRLPGHFSQVLSSTESQV